MDFSIVNWIIALLFLVVFAVWWAKPFLVDRYAKWQKKRKEQALEQHQAQRKVEEKRQGQGEESQGYNSLIVLHIEARQGSPFPGEKVLGLLEAANLVPGDMQMYQYYVEYRGVPRLVFNAINGIEPGHLDDSFRQGETPCVTLFFAIHESYDPRKSLETMLRVAEDLARDLDGLLQDNQRSVLTEQTKQHLIHTVERHILNSSQAV